MLIRPFRNHAGRPGKKQPKGSVELKPKSPINTKKCTLTHRTVCDINVYDMLSKKTIKDSDKKRIYYFGGGGWQSATAGYRIRLSDSNSLYHPSTLRP